MDINQYINPHRLSNTYVLVLEDDTVVLVDVGNFDTQPFLDWLKIERKTLTHVILTHEHADHCCGVDALAKASSFQLVCTAKCEENMRNSRHNFSYYLDEIDTFEVEHRDVIIVGDHQEMTIGNKTFSFVETPGHSPGGMCIITENYFFSGDTILNGVKSPLTFPHSDRKAYCNSIEKLKGKLKEGMQIFPGHDSPLFFKNFESLFM